MHRSLLTNRNIIFVRLNGNNIMKIVYNKFIPFKGYLAINLFGVLFVRGTRGATQHRINNRLLTHEEIHTAQMKELGYIFFYLWYFVEYCIIRLFHRKQNCAYHDVSFEEEAYLHEYDYNYLKNRKHYSWVGAIRIKSNHTHTGRGYCQK